MAHPTLSAASVEAAQSMVERGKPSLVLAEETLRQIEDAEAQGGFEGGMSGNADGGGFSAPGSSGPSFSSADDLPPVSFDSDVTVLGISDALSGENVLPGFSFPLAALFAED